MRIRLLLPAAVFLLVGSCADGDRPPSAVSVTPVSGSSRSQTFALVYAAPNGFSDLTDVRVLFAAGTDAVDACYVEYDPVRDTLRLADDNAVDWAAIPLRSTASAENRQCQIHAAGSSASGGGRELTVKLAITFKRAFAGRQNVFLSAVERQGPAAALTKKGTWVVPYLDADADAQ